MRHSQAHLASAHRLAASLALASFAGACVAQTSSVRLYGTIDVTARVVKADSRRRVLSEATDGLNGSQLGISGVEDLGGGMSAGFTLLSGVNADAGTSNAKFWNRRSTVSLLGRWGEVRLGRDYVPTFWNVNYGDVNGLQGVGSAAFVHQMYEGTRQDNTIGYFLPTNLGGLYGQAMVSAAEGGTSGDKPTRYLGARVGYASGPFDVAIAASNRRHAAQNNVGTAGTTGAVVGVVARPGDIQRTYNAYATWNFGFMRLVGVVDREELRGVTETAYGLGVRIPISQAEVRFAYDRSTLRHALNAPTSRTVDQIKAAMTYNMSRRTAIFGTVTRLDNKDNTTLTLPSAGSSTKPGGKSQGAEVGVRHFF